MKGAAGVCELRNRDTRRMAGDGDDTKTGHTLQDHVYGEDLAHIHDGDADHDHDHFEVDGPLEDNPIWIQDHVTLTSVGIDIGSAGTQIIFSRINLRRLGEDLSSRYVVVARETLYQSPVALTPYRSEELIDETALGAIIDAAYAAAGVAPADIDTGAVILTGEALRRENAARDRRRPVAPGRRFRLRHRRPSHGGDARGLRVGRRARVARYGQAYPQHRHRRRHDQARADRAGPRDRDRRRAHRRPTAGGGGGRARSSGSTRPASTMRRAPGFPGARATRSTSPPWTGWPT